MSYVHLPIMAEEIITYAIKDSDKYFLDCTLGEGGHSEKVLTRFPGITVYGLDRDKEILKVAGNRLSIFNNRFNGYNINFKDVTFENINFVNHAFDTALIDLGISVYHYKSSNRGFSFAKDEALSMQLDDESIDVARIINEYPESALADIFKRYGEERFAKRIASKIVEAREYNEITRSNELAQIIAAAIPVRFQPKKIHPATKCFQALRIYANNELENIEIGVPRVFNMLKKGGRLAVITFHSLEDRIVKRIFAQYYKDCICPPGAPICTCDKKREIKYIAKMVKPSPEEIEINPASRSAKLRVIEKL